MSYSALNKTAQHLSSQASFIVEIIDDEEYQQALILMDEIIDDYDHQLVLIELLSKSIERWENVSPEFEQFNQRTTGGDAAYANGSTWPGSV